MNCALTCSECDEMCLEKMGEDCPAICKNRVPCRDDRKLRCEKKEPTPKKVKDRRSARGANF